LMLFLPSILPKPPTRSGGQLSAADFQKYVRAETEARLGAREKPLAGAKTNPLAEARDLYADLADKKASGISLPNLHRRVLILNALLGQKSEVRARETPEPNLWRALYEKDTTQKLPPDAESQVKAMQLGFLEPVALADIARKTQQESEATRQMTRWYVKGATYRVQQIYLNLLQLLALFVGFILFFFVRFPLTKYASQKLEIIEKSEDKKHLIEERQVDGFLFYLFLYYFSGLVVRYGVMPFIPHYTPLLRIGLSLATQFGMGFIALEYLRRNGVTRQSIGLSTKTLKGDIFFGIKGYCLMLPVILIMSLLTRRIFGENSDATPNPMLPLLAGTTEWSGRLMLFSMVGLGAPFFEEVFFRGTLWTGLRARFPFSLASLLTTVLFAALHPMVDWLPILGMGMVFASLREARQSLVPCIVTHCLQNSLTFLGLAILFS
jgi:membrane protease YdiL (CAAX protease family)